MMLGARNGAWAKSGGGVPTAKDYVQDGLIAMLDGIENAGWGVHDPNLAGWRNLASGANATRDESHTSFGYDHLLFDGSQNSYYCRLDSFPGRSDIVTVEWVGVNSGDNFAYALYCPYGNNMRPGLHLGFGGGFFGGTQLQASADNSGTFSLIYATDKNSSPTEAWHNAVSCPLLFKNDFADVDSGSGIVRYGGGGTKDKYTLHGSINSLRCYNRALIAAEIAHNYAIDKARFNLP